MVRSRWYDPSRCTFQQVASALLADSRYKSPTRPKNTNREKDPDESPTSPWLAPTPLGNYIRQISDVERDTVAQLMAKNEKARSATLPPVSPRYEAEVLALPVLPTNERRVINTVGQPGQVWEPCERAVPSRRVSPSPRANAGSPSPRAITNGSPSPRANGNGTPSPRAIGASPSPKPHLGVSRSAPSVGSGASLSDAERFSGHGTWRTRGARAPRLPTCKEPPHEVEVDEVPEIPAEPSAAEVSAAVGSRRARSSDPAGVQLPESPKRRRNSLFREEDSDGEDLTPRRALRREFRRKVGSLAAAMKHLDVNGNDRVSTSEFQMGLESMHINWGAVTGIASISALFKCFDKDHSGELGVKEICGADYKKSHDDSNMTTEELWNQWCELATQLEESRASPKKSTTMDTDYIMMRDQLFANQDQQKRKMKYLFTKGMRSLVSGKLLRKDSANNRRAEVDAVLQRGKKIHEVIVDMSYLRRDLNSTRKAMEDVMRSAHDSRLEGKRALIEKKCAVMRGFSAKELEGMQQILRDKNGEPMRDDLATMFDTSRMGLSTDAIDKDNVSRNIAKEYSLGFQQVERLRKEFESWDSDKSGFLEEAEFGQMIKKICNTKTGIKPSATRISEFWAQVDVDHSSCVSFLEFAQWLSGPGDFILQAMSQTGTKSMLRRTSVSLITPPVIPKT